MRLLLDTCVFLWTIWDEPPLHERARAVLKDRHNELCLSPISVWEAVIKHQLGKLSLRADGPAWTHFVRQRELHGIQTLPVTEAEVQHLSQLPDHHHDPFDRLLICQAIEHGLTILTPDPQIRRYPVKTFW